MVKIRRQESFLKREYGHLHRFNRETALRLIGSAGLEVIRYRFTFGSVELPLRSFNERLAYLPRALGKYFFPGLAARTFGRFSLMIFARNSRLAQ